MITSAMPRLHNRFYIDMFSDKSKELNDLVKMLITGCEIDYFNNIFKIFIIDPLEKSEMLHNALFNHFVVEVDNCSINSSKHFIYISDANNDCFVTLKVKPLEHKVKYTYTSDTKEALHVCTFKIYDIDAV